jgi:uncharacterized membrane protein YbhN (UPF0104 family)
MSLPSPGALIGALAGVDVRIIVLALLINAAGVWIRSEAWRRLLVHASGERVRSWDVFSAYVLGLVGNVVLPARAGEVVRVGVLARRMPTTKRAGALVAGSSVAHRILDAPPFALLVLLATVLAGTAVIGGVLTVAIVLGAVLVIGLVALLARRPVAHHRSRGRIGRIWAGVRLGIAGLGDAGTAAGALALETLAWALQLVVVWLVLGAFGLPASVGAAALTLVAINLAVAIPLIPGGVGLFQAATALSLGVAGVGAATGVAFGIGLQAVEILTTLLLVVPVGAREGATLGRLVRDARAGSGGWDAPVDAEASPEAAPGAGGGRGLADRAEA